MRSRLALKRLRARRSARERRVRQDGGGWAIPPRRDVYTPLLAATTDLLDRHDPLGMSEIGAPAGEYDIEAADIVRLALHAPASDTRAAADIVDEVFIHWFEQRPARSDSRAIAEEVVALVERELLE